MSVATTSRTGHREGRGGVRGWFARRHSGPWGQEATALAVVVGLLLVVGLVMSFSASVVDAAENGDPFGILRRQVAWAAIGVPAFLVVSSTDHRVWRRLSWAMLAAAVVGLLLVLVPGLGLTRGGSTRWLGIGPLVVQPAELAKLSALLWLADVMERKRPGDGGPHELRHLLVPGVPLLAVLGALILAEPDLGTSVVVGIIVALVLYIEGLPLRLFGLFAGVGGLLATALAFTASYRVDRITGWLNPEADPTGTGFQLLQSLYALGSGGWFGLGLGSSRGKWNFVPNPETDFVFAIIGEELGLVGALVVLALFAALLVLGMRIARRAPDGFSRTVAFGITGWIVAQATINVATVVGLLPITGMTLPLVSAGGSSLVSTLVALGILVSIARDPASRDLDART
jgi:cell division protein FtsW